jgi:hypothetical protein
MVVPTERALTTLLNDPTQFASAPTYDAAFFTPLVFENRTSLITDPPDGRLPEYTAAGRSRRTQSRKVEGVQDLPVDTRCISFGMPRLAGVAGTPSAGIYAYYQIVQTSDYVVFFMEAVHEARIIPLDGRPHLSRSMGVWDGDSRGRWDGDTLVVDAVGFNDKTWLDTEGHQHSDALHVIERFRRTTPDAIAYEVTIEDPKTYSRPWSSARTLTRHPDWTLKEYVCEENNKIKEPGR